MDISKKTLIVLGHKGMLGQMIMAYFKDKVASIVTLSTRFDQENKWKFIDSESYFIIHLYAIRNWGKWLH